MKNIFKSNTQKPVTEELSNTKIKGMMKAMTGNSKLSEIWTPSSTSQSIGTLAFAGAFTAVGLIAYNGVKGVIRNAKSDKKPKASTNKKTELPKDDEDFDTIVFDAKTETAQARKAAITTAICQAVKEQLPAGTSIKAAGKIVKSCYEKTTAQREYFMTVTDELFDKLIEGDNPFGIRISDEGIVTAVNVNNDDIDD